MNAWPMIERCAALQDPARWPARERAERDGVPPEYGALRRRIFEECARAFSRLARRHEPGEEARR